MQFNRETEPAANAIVACDAGEVRLRDRRFTASVIITRSVVLADWRAPAAAQLAIGDFERLLALAPEIVLLGTGARQRMPPPELFASFAGRGIGLEVMDNRAACRTFNLLLSEARDVALALML